MSHLLVLFPGKLFADYFHTQISKYPWSRGGEGRSEVNSDSDSVSGNNWSMAKYTNEWIIIISCVVIQFVGARPSIGG